MTSVTPERVARYAELIVKVKEPQPVECALLRDGQILFTYLHLAADRMQAQGLIDSKAVAIAYETVTATDGSLPLLTPEQKAKLAAIRHHGKRAKAA